MKLIRYVVTLDGLTLTFLRENGEELVVPINSKTIPEQIAMDVIDLHYDGDGWTRPPIRQITRNIDPQDGIMLRSEQDVEFEVESEQLSLEDLVEL